MPYIIQQRREVLNAAISDLLNNLRELESDLGPSNNMEGNINYVFTRILKHVYSGNTYRDLNDAMGILACCQAELYRRVGAPMEDQKMYDNGDV